MFYLCLIGQEDLTFLLFGGVLIKSSPMLLHKAIKYLLELPIDQYLLQFRNDGVKLGILSRLIRASISIKSTEDFLKLLCAILILHWPPQ